MPRRDPSPTSSKSASGSHPHRHLQKQQQQHPRPSTKPLSSAAVAAAAAAEVGTVDPAYMKQFSHSTMETRDLGRRLSQDQLKQLSERNLMNRPFELGFLDGPISEGVSDYERLQQQQQLEQRRLKQLKKHPLVSGSNADRARREAVLQGEFDIISRSHVARFEQDSAFKKEQRPFTPETVALQANRRGLISRGVLPRDFQYPPALGLMAAANASSAAAAAAAARRSTRRTTSTDNGHLSRTH